MIPRTMKLDIIGNFVIHSISSIHSSSTKTNRMQKKDMYARSAHSIGLTPITTEGLLVEKAHISGYTAYLKGLQWKSNLILEISQCKMMHMFWWYLKPPPPPHFSQPRLLVIRVSIGESPRQHHRQPW
mmetsp:Transcript_35043/g.47064  ORF Transcript_35043/g.47064 Transcript_35043/m.47064 type:complete len:128 (+) Transcript_35043:1914-2297(+)